MRDVTMSGMPPELMTLPADAFVEAAVKAQGLQDVSPRDVHALTQAILRGVNKSRIWEALSARNEGRLISPPAVLPTALVRADDDLVIEDVLVDHAPGDDVAFIEYAFARLVGRHPELHERLALQAELAADTLSRSAAVQRIISTGRSEERAPTVARMSGTQPFAIVSGERAERQLLIRRSADSEYIFAEGALKNARVTGKGVELFGGLAIAGPGRPLRPGLWRLFIDWQQPEDAAIAIEVTANGGAESLVAMEVAGPAVFAAEFRIKPEHVLAEVLVHGVRSAGDTWIVQPREVSLAWVGK